MTGSEDPGIGRCLKDAVLTFHIDERLCRMSIHVGVHVWMPAGIPRVLPYTLEIAIHTVAPAVSRLRPACRDTGAPMPLQGKATGQGCSRQPTYYLSELVMVQAQG
jgi:hypothetical protein